MLKLYQKSWHSINFCDLKIKISRENLPGDSFYEEFYKKFHEIYDNLDKLDSSWLTLKKIAADQVSEYLGNSKDLSILSIGAGLGIIEKRLFDLGYKNLYIQEVSETATIYSRAFIKSQNIFIGNFPKCINTKDRFDVILLGNIEYLFDDFEFLKLLKDTKKFMHKKSKLIILSWSIEKENIFFKIKYKIKSLLINIGLFNPGQFWGYCRKLKELMKLANNAGFKIKVTKLDRNIKPWITGFLLLEK